MSVGFSAGLLADLGSHHPAGVLALAWLLLGLGCGLLADRAPPGRDRLGRRASRSASGGRRLLGAALGAARRAVELGRADRGSARCRALLGDAVAGRSGRAAPCASLLRAVRALAAARRRRARSPRAGAAGIGWPSMGDRGARRVAFIGVLIASLLLTLIGRLYYVQVLDKNPPTQAADGRTGTIVRAGDPGRDRRRPGPAAGDQHADPRDHRRPADAAGRSPTRAPPCWPGWPRCSASPKTDAGRVDHPVRGAGARPVLDRRALPAGAGRQRRQHRGRAGDQRAPRGLSRASRSRPAPRRTTRAARWPRRCSATPARSTPTDQKADPKLADADSIGRAGLEAAVRQRPARGRRPADARADAGRACRSARSRRSPPKPGDTLVTSIDATVQALAEKALSQRDRGRPRERQAGDVGCGRGDGPEHRPDHRRRQLPDLRPDRVRRRHLDRRLREADRARRQRPAGRTGDRRRVRARARRSS